MKPMGCPPGICQNFQCSYNLFEGVRECNRHPNDETDRMGNCVLRVDHTWTLEEIAQIWGLTRERVRQIQDKAIEKLALKMPNNVYGLLDITTEKIAKRRQEAHEFLRDGPRSHKRRHFEATP